MQSPGAQARPENTFTRQREAPTREMPRRIFRVVMFVKYLYKKILIFLYNSYWSPQILTAVPAAVEIVSTTAEPEPELIMCQAMPAPMSRMKNTIAYPIIF